MKYLWSKRVDNVGHYNLLRSEEVSNENVIKKYIMEKVNNIIWIRNTSSNVKRDTDLDIFAKLLHLLPDSVILITCDGDRSVPSSYKPNTVEKILSHPKILKWYSQNYDYSIQHSKLSYYPIGLDMHTVKWLPNSVSNEETRQQKIKMYLDIREEYKNKKKMSIFCDAHLTNSHTGRKEVRSLLDKNKLIDFLGTKISYTEIAKRYASYQFVLSPRGRGMDCHRTWEVILLGSIVIVESSPLDAMFKENNLPVVIVQNFSVLNEWTLTDLEKLKEKYLPLTNFENIEEKFDPEYWIKGE